MPRIRVHIHDGHANEVLAAVTSGVADFGLNFDGQQEGGLAFRALLRDRFVLACHRDHPLAQRRTVRWSELAAERVLASGSVSGNRLLLERSLSQHGERLQPVAEARHVQTVLGLVEKGLGVAPVPQLALHPSLDAVVGVPLVRPSVYRTIGLIRRQGVLLGPAAQALHDFILEDHPRRGAGTTR
jgi:DNA-binding transcriptional LysR family regulator